MSESSGSAPDVELAAAADGARARIIDAAVGLIAAGGRDAATTRAVAAAAGVQPPAIYRQFGDMRGLLDAAAREALAAYLAQKGARLPSDDPVADLRQGWDLHVAFGLANPAVYALVYGDPTGGALPTAAREGEAHLHALVARVAAAGRLRVGVAHAARLIAAAGNGVTLALIAAPPASRDPHLADAMREAVLAAVTIDAPTDEPPVSTNDPAGSASKTSVRVAARAVALRAVLAEAEAPDAGPLEADAGPLSRAEQQLLGEWLDRLAGARA